MSNGMNPNEASCDPTEKTIHEEPHDGHWGTWNDRVFICGGGSKKGIGISDGCETVVKPIPEWIQLNNEVASLVEALEKIAKFKFLCDGSNPCPYCEAEEALNKFRQAQTGKEKV